MYFPKYAMFFDNHTMKACPDVGCLRNADEFAESLKDAGVDFIGFHAKCNQGFSYYDTKIGIRHPSLPEGRDLFGETLRACSERGIKVSAYLNCGLSNETAIRHPDWCTISPSGGILQPEIYGIGWVTPYMRTMCFNTPYRDYLLAQIREVMEKYDVAGFLFDSFNGFPCICPHCVEGMKKLGLDWRCETDIAKFARISILRMAGDISAMLKARNPDYLHYYLGVAAPDNARIGGYMECECLPTNPGWGYDYLPLMARYMRTLRNDCPILNMTGRFNDWGDFGSVRPAAALEYDAFFGLANGMRPNIGDHYHPRGEINRGVFKRVKEVYSNIRRYEPWYDGAKNLVDAGVVIPSGHIGKTPELVGASRMLSELKAQFDFIGPECDWDKYRVLILPDAVTVTPDIKDKIARHLAAGKKILATGRSGLNEDGSAFVFEREWGVKYLGEADVNPVYFRMEPSYADGLPDMPLAAYAPASEIEMLPGTELAGRIIAPYFNKHWDGVYSFFYTPPDKPTEKPFAAISKQVVYCSAKLFSGYYEMASADLRRALETLLKTALPDPLMKTDSSLPSFARAFAAEGKNASRIAHLLCYSPELRGKSIALEEPGLALDVKIAMRLDGKKVSAVSVAPEKTPLPFEIADGYVSFTVPKVRGYALIVIE